MDFNQSGSALSGGGYFDGTLVGTINGSVGHNNFGWRLTVFSTYGGGYADFEATTNGSTFTGTYEASAGGYGPISGNRMSSNSVTGQSGADPLNALRELRSAFH
jgi:hypothetical protein